MDGLAALVEKRETPEARPPKRKRQRQLYVKREPYNCFSIKEGFDPEPGTWADDGGAKRVAVYDRNVHPPRLIRKVGWVKCLGRFSVQSPHRIFSPDVAKVRMCDRCKRPDYSAYRSADDD
jgi:hypothetical protein